MPDIFLSYNREDQSVARRFAEAFERVGFSVWWDVSLRSGEAYDKITEQALTDAKAVVVLWSPRSVDSRWVRAEATAADRAGKLVPVMIEACKRPIMFELTQTADLTHWNGDPNDRQWLALLDDVKRFAQKQPSATPQPGEAPPTKPPFKLPGRIMAIGAVALAAIVAVAIAGAMLLGQKPAAPSTQRIAFFGFASGGGALADEIASSATDETFQTMLAMRLETGARSATRNIEPAQQYQTAGRLGAAYILGGEVRENGERISISMRLDDVASNTTLWEDTIAGAASDRISLPVTAAVQVTARLRCITGLRGHVARPDGEVRNVIASACSTGGNLTREKAALWRELAGREPPSSWVLGQFAASLYGYQTTPAVTPAEWPALLEEARTAAQKAADLDPTDAHARTSLAMNAIAEGRPLIEAGTFLQNSKDVPDDFRKGIQSRARSRLLGAVGDNVDALAAAKMSVEFDPLNVSSRLVLSMTLARVGRWAEAYQEFEQSNERLADSALWQTWFFHTALLDPAATDNVLAKAPPAAAEATRTCWKQIAASMRSRAAPERARGAGIVKQCRADGRIDPVSAAGALADLGDIDGAFAAIKAPLDRKNPLTFLTAASILFSQSARAMRADPRFLPLIQELGVFQYWVDAKTRPDVCDTAEEKDLAFCQALRAQ